MDYDAELAGYDVALHRAWAIGAYDRVLDIGCGAGGTTRAAARMTSAGSAFGVDVSAPAIARARSVAAAEGLSNVAFEVADAQTHPFEPGSFDLAISRFGTMFFDEPVAAFANIGRALRAYGRLVMLIWQLGERNEWDVAIRQALPGEPPPGPDPFSLGDRRTVEGILAAAGFTDVEATGVEAPVYFGPDTDAALAWVRGFACTSGVLQRLEPAAAARALAGLRDMLDAHRTDDGIRFGSRAWIVTGRRAQVIEAS
ncbi:class I SAM-dependent methyltransferase [Paractinoplanes globisporus]|uniref:Class I SAM-dependent methyltransferase n=1 Tax=Paractinoplanes globisporus TaxID=113565 RepID=A0ABW6WIL2_9ACTN|nr:class I SAM-dependent methyltransferase [Actinoplanes globisporus]